MHLPECLLDYHWTIYSKNSSWCNARTDNILLLQFRDAGRGAHAPPPDFVRSVTLSQPGGRLCPHISTCPPPQIFRPSDIPAHHQSLNCMQNQSVFWLQSIRLWLLGVVRAFYSDFVLVVLKLPYFPIDRVSKVEFLGKDLVKLLAAIFVEFCCHFFLSSNIMRRPQNLKQSSVFYYITSVKTKWKSVSNFCGLLRMYEL